MNDVFVFGSNTEGRHGAGAAQVAHNVHGAKWGTAEGRQGNSYAIVTKDLRKGIRSIPLGYIALQVQDFLKYAGENPDERFIVTQIGCGLAGYRPKEIAPMFRGAPSNVVLPLSFTEVLQAGGTA